MGKSGYQLRSQILIWALLITTLGVTPFYSYDPINIFRATAVLIFGLISAGVLVINFKSLLSKENRTVLFLSVLCTSFNPKISSNARDRTRVTPMKVASEVLFLAC